MCLNVYRLLYDQTFDIAVFQSRDVLELFTCLRTEGRSDSVGRGTCWIDDHIVNLNKTIGNQNKLQRISLKLERSKLERTYIDKERPTTIISKNNSTAGAVRVAKNLQVVSVLFAPFYQK